jgi:hypothetical protein
MALDPYLDPRPGAERRAGPQADHQRPVAHVRLDQRRDVVVGADHHAVGIGGLDAHVDRPVHVQPAEAGHAAFVVDDVSRAFDALAGMAEEHHMHVERFVGPRRQRQQRAGEEQATPSREFSVSHRCSLRGTARASMGKPGRRRTPAAMERQSRALECTPHGRPAPPQASALPRCGSQSRVSSRRIRSTARQTA